MKNSVRLRQSWGTEKTHRQHHSPQEGLREESSRAVEPGAQRPGFGAVWSPDQGWFQMLPFPFKFSR